MSAEKQANVGDSRYRCACHTCDQEHIKEAVLPAIQYYEYHAGQDHAVVVIRLADEVYLAPAED